jgi:hypothetical protein
MEESNEMVSYLKDDPEIDLSDYLPLRQSPIANQVILVTVPSGL